MRPRRPLKRGLITAATVVSMGMSMSAAGASMGTAPSGLGATVAGWGAETFPGGILATSQQLQMDSTWVAQTVGNAIEQVGQALADGQRKQIQAHAKLLDSLAAVLEKMRREEFKAQRAQQRQQQYGKLSRPSGACSSPALGAGLGQGDMNQVLISQKIGQAQTAYNGSMHNKGEIRNRLKDLEDDETAAEAILPSDGAIDDKKDALSFINTAINPHPQIPISDDIKNTAAGQQYEAAVKVLKSRRSLSEKTIRSVMMANLPSIPLGEWAQSAWEKAGHTGSPDSVINGQISPMGLNKLFVQLRTGNPEWYKQVSGRMNDTALLRELVIMTAQSMRMQYQQLSLNQQLAALQATQTAMQLEDSEHDTLVQKRNAAVSSSGGH